MPTLTPVAWCCFCRHYLPHADAGTRCPSEGCHVKLRARRMHLCPRCGEAFPDSAALAMHVAGHDEP